MGKLVVRWDTSSTRDHADEDHAVMAMTESVEAAAVAGSMETEAMIGSMEAATKMGSMEEAAEVAGGSHAPTSSSPDPWRWEESRLATPSPEPTIINSAEGERKATVVGRSYGGGEGVMTARRGAQLLSSLGAMDLWQRRWCRLFFSAGRAR